MSTMDLESHSQTMGKQQYVSTSEMRQESDTTNALACNIGSLLSFSCRTRAEDFARKLQLKLKTLGSFDNDQQPSDESFTNSWKSLSLDSHLNRQEQLKTQIEANNGDKKNLEKRDGRNTSDMFYDFDIGSPGSPTELGFSLINACDDLYCKDCLSSSSSNGETKMNPKRNGGAKNSETDSESGYIFSSPESSSPDAISVSPQFNIIEHSTSADDCTSDASDCSIYYDVESFSPATFPSSPKEKSFQGADEIETDFQKPLENGGSTENDEIEVPLLNELNLNETVPLIVMEGPSEESGDKNGLNDEICSSDDDESSSLRPRVLRCSSLKTGKTPPGTPGRKKIVRFADALGLDLAAVRTFLDEIPRVPKSAYKDLDCPIEPLTKSFTSTAAQRSGGEQNKILVPTFHQPSSRPDFFDRVRDNKVLLENAYLCDNFTIKGTVRVLNMDFYKSVYIRYTYDEWKTFTDFQATYVSGSCDGFSDRFEFIIYLRPEMIEIGSRVILAARFHCKGEQFWDNNSGHNYLFHCVPASSQSQQNFYQDSSSLYNNIYSQSPSEDPWTNHMWL